MGRISILTSIFLGIICLGSDPGGATKNTIYPFDPTTTTALQSDTSLNTDDATMTTGDPTEPRLTTADYGGMNGCTTFIPPTRKPGRLLDHYIKTLGGQQVVVVEEVSLLLPPPQQGWWGLTIFFYHSGRVYWLVSLTTNPHENVTDKVWFKLGRRKSQHVSARWSTPTSLMSEPRQVVLQVGANWIDVLEVSKGRTRLVAERNYTSDLRYFPDVTVRVRCNHGDCGHIRQCKGATTAVIVRHITQLPSTEDNMAIQVVSGVAVVAVVVAIGSLVVAFYYRNKAIRAGEWCPGVPTLHQSLPCHTVHYTEGECNTVLKNPQPSAAPPFPKADVSPSAEPRLSANQEDLVYGEPNPFCMKSVATNSSGDPAPIPLTSLSH